MAESKEFILSGSDIPYDFGRYVLIINKNSWSSKEVSSNICEEAPYRVIPDSKDHLNWGQIIIKYPHSKIALREGIIFSSQVNFRNAFDVVMVAHVLAFLTKLERECDETLKKPTCVSISRFPGHIKASKWKKLLSRFGKVEVGRKWSKEEELVIIAKYETMAEAVGVIIALHGHNIDGKELVVKLCRREKENTIFSAYRERYQKCPSLLDNFPLAMPPVRTTTAAETNEEQDRMSSSGQILLCIFCCTKLGQSSEDVYSLTGRAVSDDVSWADEFPELQDCTVESGFVVVDDDWEFVEEEDCTLPNLEEECWEVVNYSDFQARKKL